MCVEKFKRCLFLFLFFFCAFILRAQTTETLHIKKDLFLIYFFQKGVKSDTVLKNKTDLFYLLVPDSLMGHVSVFVENGLLRLTENDSLVRLVYLQGLNYESVYRKEEPGNDNVKLQRRDLKSWINGTPSVDIENRLVIRIVDHRGNKPIVENTFYYKD